MLNDCKIRIDSVCLDIVASCHIYYYQNIKFIFQSILCLISHAGDLKLLGILLGLVPPNIYSFVLHGVTRHWLHLFEHRRHYDICQERHNKKRPDSTGPVMFVVLVRIIDVELPTLVMVQ